MDNEILSRDERICVLKKSLNDVTDKLIRSYRVIARLNYQNNTMRKKLQNTRKTIPLSALAVVFMLLFSCEDDAKYCWKCTVVTRLGNAGDIVTTIQSKCDMTNSEIELFEKEKNAVCVKD